MDLQKILQGLAFNGDAAYNTSGIEISGIADSSSAVEPGDLFVALKGANHDGHEYIDQAIRKGAAAVIGEKEFSSSSVPYIQVENSRKALGLIARNFYGNPSGNKIMIGITGTNGKTTTSYLLKHILEYSGKTCSVIGTIQNMINGEVSKSFNTTPNSLVLQRLLSTSNDEIVIIEVSSHGLAQYRVEGMEFDFCLFTNLHHEHLDYHHTMEHYFETKAALFNQLKNNGRAIVNADNEWGQKLAVKLKESGKAVYTAGHAQHNLFRILELDTERSTVLIEENNETVPVFSPMIGIHNLYNTTLAYATAKLIGVPHKLILESTRHFNGVSGRFEISTSANGATVVVDYAHTPDAVLHCLTTAKNHGAQKIVHVFGFRGDRDKSKRADMLRISAKMSDQYILTFDDLNSVSSDEMIETLNDLNAQYGNNKGIVIPDRSLAIKYAIDHSSKADWILITGKGHEKYQQNYELQTESDKDTVDYLIGLNDKKS